MRTVADQRSPARRAADRLLEDGPQPQETVVRTMMAHVPPGQAWRTAEQVKAGARRRRGHLGRDTVDHRDNVATGARSVALRYLHAALQKGRWRRLPDGRIEAVER